MGYSGSTKGITISRERAFKEMRRHGFDETTQPEWGEFAEWLGDRQSVSASAVLEWLGY